MKMLYIFLFLENSHSISKYGLESTGVHMEYQENRQDLTILFLVGWASFSSLHVIPTSLSPFFSPEKEASNQLYCGFKGTRSLHNRIYIWFSRYISFHSIIDKAYKDHLGRP